MFGFLLGFIFCLIPARDPVPVVLQPGMSAVSSILPSGTLAQTQSLEKEECDRLYGMQLCSDAPYHWIMDPGATIRLVADCRVTDRPYSVRAVFWDYLGRTVHIEELGPAPCRVPLDITVQGNGVYLITLDAIDVNGVWQSRLVRSVSALPDNSGLINVWRTAGSYTLGSCFDPHRYGVWATYHYPDMTADDVINAIASVAERMGFQALRIDAAGATFDLSRMDEVVTVLTNHNQRVNFIIPAQASDAVEPGLSAWRGRVSEFIARYADAAWLFEIENEPAHYEFFDGDAEAYLTLLSNACTCVEAIPAPVNIVNGGLCSWDLPETVTRGHAWYETFIPAGAPHLDMTAYHFHGTLPDLFTNNWLEDYKNLYAAAGGDRTPWVQTEGGICFWRLDQEVTQSPCLLQKIFWSWASGDKGWVVYSLFGAVSPAWNGTSDWPIFDEATFCAKFPAGQISALINWFAGYTEGEILENGDSLILLKFHAPDGRCSLVGFTKDGTLCSERIGFNGPTAELYDPQGNVTATAANGVIEARFSAYPCWVETTGDVYLPVE
jgi:hypothetical protein